MKAAPSCTKCSTPIPAEYFNSAVYQRCSHCESLIRIDVFPSYFREEVKGSSGEILLVDSEASCFYHAAKKAAVVCSSCGRFLCSLCDFELEGAHYCSNCLESAKEKGKLTVLENSRRIYDTLALQLAVAGFVLIVFPYLIPFTALGAIFFAIRYWKAPTSLVRKQSRWRQITALVIATLQLGAIATGILIIVFKLLE